MAQPSTEPRSGTVQSVERVFELLEIIADAGGEASLSDLAATSELPMPTIHRLLRTCVLLGYARQLPSRRYALGARLIPLGERAGRQLGRVAQPKLVELVRQLGETANMALMDGDQIVYVAQQPSPHAMRMFTEVGRRVQPHCTAVGKALLAATTDEEVRALLQRTGLPRHTPHTVTDPDEFLAQLGRVRDSGYAMDEGEQEVGVRCIAVKVPESTLPLAISVSGPAPRMTDDLVADAFPVLRAAAASFAADLA